MELVYLLIFLISCLIEDIDNVLLKKTNIKAFKYERILHVSEEPSLLQCAQRCRFIDKNSIVDFTNSKCTCIKYEGDEGQEHQGTLTGVFVNQKLMKSTKPALERDVDGNYTEWASWSSCNATIEKKDGIRERNRSCSNPPPRGAGTCHRLGLAHEIKACTNAHMFFANTFEAVKKNRTIGTIEKWQKEYIVKLILKLPTSDQLIQYEWYTVLRLTNGNTNYDIGTRVPAIFFYYGTPKSSLLVDSAFETYLTLQPSDFVNPINIEITQRLQGTDYIYQVIINNKTLASQINRKPMEYSKVRIYAGGSHYQPIGFIKDLLIQGFYNNFKIFATCLANPAFSDGRQLNTYKTMAMCYHMASLLALFAILLDISVIMN